MINQMYVQFQKPAKSNAYPRSFRSRLLLELENVETTPDGGWLYEYFTRKGFDTYMADQVGRARSGFDALQYQKVRYDSEATEFADDGNGVGCVNGPSPPGPNPAGCLAPEILAATRCFRLCRERPGQRVEHPDRHRPVAWNVFRYGPPCTAPCGAFTSRRPLHRGPTSSSDGDRFGGRQSDLLQAGHPRSERPVWAPLVANAADIRPTPQRMAVLARKLGGAILVGHSQSSSFPTKAALQDATGVRGIIQLETGCFLPGAGGTLTDADVGTLAKIPMLIVEGDHYTTGNPPVPQARPVSPCPEEIAAIRKAGGDITYVHLPEVAGIGTGNSHMFMQDHNNLKIADLIIHWIRHHVGDRAGNEASD